MSREESNKREQRLGCGGTQSNPHQIPMEYVSDAATPHWECPECGARAWVMKQ